MSVFAGRDLDCVRGERPVFAGLGFALRPGEALVLVGPNGSGKSSLLRCMAGLLRPAGGELSWDGVAVDEDPEAHRGRLHYVGHQDAVKAPLSVEENLYFWAGLRGTPAAGAARVDAARALAGFGIAHLARLPARLLSAGQRRRLALARLLAAPAPLWLLDEPAAALDDTALGLFEAAAAAHRADGGAVVLSAHAGFRLPAAATLSLADFPPERPAP